MKAYALALVDVNDPAAFAAYAAGAPATVAAFGGRYLVRGGNKQVLEGSLPPGRLLVVEFPSAEQAKAWYDSKEYQAIRPIRTGASKGTVLIAEGIGDAP